MIKCVLFCEFDYKLGPALVYQYPLNYLKEDQFNAHSDVLIPRPEICGKVVTIQIDQDYIVGLPVIIVNDKYERQKIEFNIAVIVAENQLPWRSVYENIVRKLASNISTLELESDLVSSKSKKSILGRVCQEVYLQLNSDGQCYVPVDEWNVIVLEVYRREMRTPPKVKLWDVPVPLCELSSLTEHCCDLTLSRVIPFIDGHKFVKEIVESSKIEENYVLSCIQHLFYHRMIEIVDIFDLSNIYRVTHRVSEVLTVLAEESVNLLAKKDSIDEASIFNYYCELADQHLNDFLTANPNFVEEVDLEKFIVFGLLNGILSRVHKYYLSNQEESIKTIKSKPLDIDLINKASKFLNGRHILDEICCYQETYKETSKENVEKLLDTFCRTFYK